MIWIDAVLKVAVIVALSIFTLFGGVMVYVILKTAYEERKEERDAAKTKDHR